MVQYLTETDISKMGRDAEDLILHNRKMLPLLLSNERYKKYIIAEEPAEIANFMLKEKCSVYGGGDVKRLTIQIAKNIKEMNWYANSN